MLKKSDFSDSDTFYILGDVIERNTSSITFLKEIMDKPNIHLPLGNYEYSMREFLKLDPECHFNQWVLKMDEQSNLSGGWMK